MGAAQCVDRLRGPGVGVHTCRDREESVPSVTVPGMTTAAIDALLTTLADVERYADEGFDLDLAMKVLENAAAELHRADAEERSLVLGRAHVLAQNMSDAAKRDFLTNVAEYLGLDS